MAIINPITAQRSIDTGGIPNTQIDDGIGRGMQQVGGAISQLAQHRIDQDNKFKDFQSKEGLIRLDDDLANELSNMQLNIDPTGRGLTEKFSPVINQKIGSFLNTVDPKIRPMMEEKVVTMRDVYVRRAAAAETQQNYKYQANSIDDQAVRNDAAVLANPDVYEAAAADNRDTINRSTLPPAAKYEIERKKDRELKLARHKGVIASDPQRFLDETGRSVKLPAAKISGEVASRGQQAMSFFTSRGYTKEQAAGIVGNLIQENAMRTSGAPGDNGTAFGLAQWRGERFNRLRRFAASSGKDWQDFGTQLAFIDMELQNYETDSYKRLKSARTVDEATAAFISYERPKGWTPSTPRAGHAYGKRLANAAAMAGLPDVEYRESNSPFSGITDNPMYDGLSVDDILALQGQARTRINQDSAAQKSYLSNTMDNAKAAYLSTGSYDGPEVSYQAVLNAYGASEGEQRWTEFQTAKSMGQFINEMKTMPSSEINNRLQSIKPVDTSSPNYATELQGYDAAVKAAASLQQSRASDPASYVQSSFPSVAGAVDAYRQAGPDQRQQAAADMYRSMDAAYDTLGILGRDRAYLPKSTVDGITDAVKDETLDLNNRISAIMTPLLATSSPEQQRNIFEQMVRADNGIAKMEAAVEAYSRGDMGAARRLFQASTMDKGSLPGKTTYDDEAIKKQIVDDIMSSSEIGDVTYGFSLNMVGTAERAKRDGDLLYKAVRLEMARNGDDLSAAIDQAKRDVYGPVQIVDDNNIRATIPDTADPKAFSNGVMSKMPAVRAALVAQLPEVKALEDLPPDQRGSYEVNRRMLNIKIDDIIDNGYWHNLGNGYGFIDPASGLPVADKNGKPLIFPMTEIIGTPAPDGVTVTQPQADIAPQVAPEQFGNGQQYYGSARANSPLGRAIARQNAPVPETASPSVQGQLKEQRSELFQNAQNNGMLDGGSF